MKTSRRVVSGDDGQEMNEPWREWYVRVEARRTGTVTADAVNNWAYHVGLSENELNSTRLPFCWRISLTYDGIWHWKSCFGYSLQMRIMNQRYSEVPVNEDNKGGWRRVFRTVFFFGDSSCCFGDSERLIGSKRPLLNPDNRWFPVIRPCPSSSCDSGSCW